MGVTNYVAEGLQRLPFLELLFQHLDLEPVLNEQLNAPELPYHNFAHTLAVCEKLNELISTYLYNNNLPASICQKLVNTAFYAAIFHDHHYVTTGMGKDHEAQSIDAFWIHYSRLQHKPDISPDLVEICIAATKMDFAEMQQSYKAQLERALQIEINSLVHPNDLITYNAVELEGELRAAMGELIKYTCIADMCVQFEPDAVLTSQQSKLYDELLSKNPNLSRESFDSDTLKLLQNLRELVAQTQLPPIYLQKIDERLGAAGVIVDYLQREL